MAKYLVIVESPAKVKTIQKFLGSNYQVAASNGHVRDMPKSRMGIDFLYCKAQKKIYYIQRKDDFMKKIFILVLCIITMLAVTGCTGEKTAENKGSVYWLNFKPEADAALQDIAKTYKEKTGVDVKVVTAASGGYNTALTSEMDKKNSPTLFVVGNMEALKTWGDYCYDLTGTEVFGKLNQDIILYNEDGSVASIGYCWVYGVPSTAALMKSSSNFTDTFAPVTFPSVIFASMNDSESGCLMDTLNINAPRRPSCATSRVELE